MNRIQIALFSLFFILGLSTGMIYKYIKDLNQDNYIIENNKLIKQMDSLELVVFQRDNMILSRDTIISSIKSRQILTDSLIVKNHSKLKNDKKKFETLSPDDRIKYVDSLLKVAGVRK